MPKKPKGGRRNRSWEKIKADYVTDPGLSLKKVSEKYGVPLDTVKKHSKAENWFATKKEHQEQYATELAQKLHQGKLQTLEQELESVQNASNVIVAILSDNKQFKRHLTTNVITGETKQEVFDKYDTRALKDTLSCLKMIEDMKRSMLGIQKIENIQKHQLDAERLQLDKDRFEFEKQKTEMFKPTEGNAIRIEGFDKEWAE